MGKKGVPEWLNSSLWSSGPSSTSAVGDQHVARYAAKPSAETPKPEVPARLAPPPVPVIPSAPPAPPPRLEPPAEVPRPETRDAGYDPSPSRFSQEDVSRQSQLLAEVVEIF